jgi:TRIAD3 protein (E3 ubiquitin-protein ligase RNF216)
VPCNCVVTSLSYIHPFRILGIQIGQGGVLTVSSRKILAAEFGQTPMTFIDVALIDADYYLFKAYKVLQEAELLADGNVFAGYSKLKGRRQIPPSFTGIALETYITSPESDRYIVEIYRELQFCRKLRAEAGDERAAAQKRVLDEEANELQAQANGTMSECGCCFGDCPMNRMVHCNGEILHWFCRDCARKMAETVIGNSKYELHCMSMEICEAGFSNDQRAQFLDSNTITALERNHQEANLRMAGIENLASCPFCPYAAEYPPPEINKEFHCQAPDCEKVSCRLCNLESHIPKSCEEFAKENGLAVRRVIEESMSAAMIRKCNKCRTPFIKEEGCNKMKCTRQGCDNVQCYICSASCGYDHFNDPARGGKAENCPLFDSVSERHDREVEEAEKAALENVRAEHPEYTEDDLKITVSAEVLRDEERRKVRDPRHDIAAAHRRALG